MTEAMFSSIFAKTLWERRRSALWWALGMAALAAITVAFFPSIRDDAESFEQLFEAFPAQLLAVFGIDDPSALLTATGLINSRVYAGVGPVILAVLGISLGTAAIAGEEERGTLNLLLSQPVSRTQVVVEKFVASTIVVGVVVAALFLTLLVADPLLDLDLSLWGMVSANLALGLLGLVFCALAFAVGGVTGNRGLTVGVAAAATAGLFFVNGLAPLVDSLAWMRNLTPFHWLQDPNPLANGLDAVFTLLPLLVIGVLMTIAVWGFNRRDITG